jgi:hypothetical protein
MGKRFLRAALTIAVVAIVWLVTAPAFASTKAPVCDPRGAVGFAPPPQLQEPEQSIDVDPSEDCSGSAEETRHLTGGRTSSSLGGGGLEPARAPSPPDLPLPSCQRVVATRFVSATGAAGVREGVERPPRP